MAHPAYSKHFEGGKMAEIDGGLLFAKALKREGVEYRFTLNGGHIYNRAEG